MSYKTNINPVLLQCKKLLVLGKCKKTYGVISPLEFVHEGVSFINMHEHRDADRVHAFNLALAAA